MSSATGTRVLIVLTSNTRRGAEIEGTRVGEELTSRGVSTSVSALSGSESGSARLPVAALGRNPLAFDTLRHLRREGRKFDLVIAFGSTTLTACAIALTGTGIPWVYRSIGDPAAWAGGRARQWRTTLQMRRAESVIAISDETSAWIRQHYGIRRVTTIPNARPFRDFPPATDAERDLAKLEFFGNTDRTVAVVGSLAEEKRPDLAVRIVAGLADTNLLIAGDGVLRGDVAHLAESLAPARVRLLGGVPDVRPVYAASDVLLVTSRTEGMPGVVLEALMAGVAVVASDVGAIRSIHPDIHLVEPDATIATWRQEIEGAASTRPDPAPMARFDWDVVGDAWFRTLMAHMPISTRG